MTEWAHVVLFNKNKRGGLHWISLEMFWLLDKAILRGMAAFWLQLPSDSPDEYQMSQSPLDCFSLWVYCSAVQQRTDMTLPCTLPGENPTWCIRLTENLIIMNSFLCNRIHVMSFCLPLACVKGSCLSVNRRSSMRGFSHVQEQTALTGSLPEQEPTQTLEVFQVCLHRKWASCCLRQENRTLMFLA